MIVDIILGTSALITIFIGEVPISYKIALMLFIGVIRLAYELVTLRKKHKKLEVEFNNVSQKHAAISSQFSKKLATIQQYENVALLIQQLLGTAVLNKKEVKIQHLAESILLHLNNINRSD